MKIDAWVYPVTKCYYMPDMDGRPLGMPVVMGEGYPLTNDNSLFETF